MFFPFLFYSIYIIIQELIINKKMWHKVQTKNKSYIQQTPLKFDMEIETYQDLQNSFVAAHRAWGGNNGGVISQNVIFDAQNLNIKIKAFGDKYSGQKIGVDRFGNYNDTKKRIGGCLVTKNKFYGGSYKYLCKLPKNSGVCCALWTFYYQQAYPQNSLHYQHLKDGIKKSFDENNNPYTIRNHEIDIQTPISNQNAIGDYSQCYFNNWRGILPGQYENRIKNIGFGLNDNKYHELRFDWYPENVQHNSKRVQFFIDSQLQMINYQNIPDIPARVWIGLWFPSGWAGKIADFDQDQLLIKNIQIIPFNYPHIMKKQAQQNIGFKQISQKIQKSTKQ